MYSQSRLWEKKACPMRCVLTEIDHVYFMPRVPVITYPCRWPHETTSRVWPKQTWIPFTWRELKRTLKNAYSGVCRAFTARRWRTTAATRENGELSTSRSRRGRFSTRKLPQTNSVTSRHQFLRTLAEYLTGRAFNHLTIIVVSLGGYYPGLRGQIGLLADLWVYHCGIWVISHRRVRIHANRIGGGLG